MRSIIGVLLREMNSIKTEQRANITSGNCNGNCNALTQALIDIFPTLNGKISISSLHIVHNIAEAHFTPHH